MKIWYFISILFCLYSLNILNEEKDILIYKSINQSEPYYYLSCFDLRKEVKILANKTTIDLNDLNQIVYDHFRKKSFCFNESEEFERFNETFLNAIKTKKLSIKRAKFVFNKRKQLEF